MKSERPQLSWIDRGHRTAAIFGLVSLLVSACAEMPVAEPQEESVVFCTDEKQAVEGALFYPRSVDEQGAEGQICITGKLIFEGLKGWYTADPLPSFAYWEGGREKEKPYTGKPSPHNAYWTGDPNTLCVIRTRIVIAGLTADRFDPSRLSLVYRASELTGNMIIGPDEKQNIAFFRLAYNQKPLAITRLYVIRLPGPDIGHALLIRAAASP